MKILLVNSYYYPDIRGGAEISVQKLAENLSSKGHEVFILCSGENKKEVINAVNILRIPFNRGEKFNGLTKRVTFKLLSMRNVSYNKSVKREIQMIKPDLIHCNNIYNISTSVWNIGKELGIPIIQTLRDYFLLCHKSTLLCGGKVCQNNRKICSIYKTIRKKQFEKIDFVTAPSEFTLRTFIENGMFDSNKSKVIYNAIDESTYKMDEIISIRNKRSESEKIQFCFLGSLVEHKGVKLLVENLKSNDKIELHIAGDGELRSYVQKEELASNSIKYHGKLSEKEVEKLLMKCDVLIVPSLWNEPFGRVVIDAYKFGMPVIASNLGGLPEIIEVNKTGIIFDPMMPNSLIECIEKMSSRKVINKMVPNCIEKVKEYSINKQIEKFEELYIKVVNKSSL